jgi:HPt (histidine-containing phosphotransfer) domain-containing protein
MSALDSHAIDELRELNLSDDSFLRDLIQIFLEDCPHRLVEIEQALAAGDSRKLTIAAHSLKGSSANFGAHHLRALCERIEHCGQQGTLGEVPVQLPALREEFGRVTAELELLLRP